MFGLIRKYTHMWDVYDRVAEYFVKPVVHFRIGIENWKKPTIWVGKYGQYKTEINNKRWIDNVKWDPNFLKTKNWFGQTWRSIVKPVFELPIFLKFGIENYGLGYKSKFDEWRFEHNPVFKVTVFGISFIWWLSAPVVAEDQDVEILEWRTGPNDDAYWESILNCAYCPSEVNFKEGLKYTGFYSQYYETEQMKDYNAKIWEKIRNGEGDKKKLYSKFKHIPVATFICSPEYIKPKYKDTWNEVYTELKSKNKKYLWRR